MDGTRAELGGGSRIAGIADTATRRTDHVDRLAQFDDLLVVAQLVDGLAYILAVVSVLDPFDPQHRIGELVRCGEYRDVMVLAVFELIAVLQPYDARRGEGLDVTVQVSVVLERLFVSRPVNGHLGANSTSTPTFRRAPLPTLLSAMQ